MKHKYFIWIGILVFILGMVTGWTLKSPFYGRKIASESGEWGILQLDSWKTWKKETEFTPENIKNEIKEFCSLNKPIGISFMNDRKLWVTCIFK